MLRRTAPLILAALLALARVSSARGRPSGVTAAADPIVPQPAGLEDFSLLSPGEGWVLLDQRLYRTNTGGARWMDITPTFLGDQMIAEVVFLDAQHGWLVLIGVDDTGFPTYALARTGDGGAVWDTMLLDLFPPGDPGAFAGDVHFHFFDAHTGWLVVKRATSTNFSAGALFYTADGGRTWTERTIPIGAPVTFVTPEIGWTAGGAAGDELYRTTDGGRTWHSQSVGEGRFYRLPAFSDPQAGVLPVVAATEEGSHLERYETEDGGRTWELSASVPIDGRVDPLALPLSTLAADGSVWAAPGDGLVLRLFDAGSATAAASRDRMADDVTNLHMVTPEAGWARSVSGHCESSSDGIRRCSRATHLLATADGGHSWTPLDLPGVDTLTRTWELPGDAASATPGIGDRTQVIQGQGFDKCEVATIPQLENWISNSPYDAVNLYIGGACRYCANSALSADYILEMSRLGWGFIPTWVGPQSACWNSARCTDDRVSNDTTTAYQQGVDEANAAIDRAIELGLAAPDGSGTVIYYDLEHYDTSDTACREAAQAFISGWSGRIQALGSQAGVYSNGPPLSTFASIDHVPDVIWPAHWIYDVYNPDATVWDVYNLPNTLWSNHERIRQYAGDHNESWGGVTLHIDCDVIDGVVHLLTMKSVYLPLILRN